MQDQFCSPNQAELGRLPDNTAILHGTDAPLETYSKLGKRNLKAWQQAVCLDQSRVWRRVPLPHLRLR